MTKAIVGIALAALAGAIWYFGILISVPEGWNAVVYNFGGRAIRVATPGANYKLPFFQSYSWCNTRQQSNEELMEASSYDNMPLKVKMSQTWQITDCLEFVRQFGTAQYFESALLDRYFREVAKDVIPKYSATNLMRDRNAASDAIDKRMNAVMAGYPVVIKSTQIEDVDPPREFREAVVKVEQANKKVEEEKALTLAQKETAQREVNTQEAKAKGIEAVARAEANQKLWLGEAEAKAAQLVGDAISKNARLVEYEYAKRWAGSLPAYMMPSGTSPSMLFGAPSVPTGK